MDYFTSFWAVFGYTIPNYPAIIFCPLHLTLLTESNKNQRRRSSEAQRSKKKTEIKNESKTMPTHA